jgi:ATP phosphoribosyltransferase regulatory subunit
MSIHTPEKYHELLHTPDGVRDIYGKENARKQKVLSRVLEAMHLYGYEDLQTPAFEYFDVFSREIGTTPSRDLYKFFDAEGNTLTLRPDFTPPVARCVAKYFMDEKNPLRFCYQGSAFVNTSALQGKRSESTQTGVELINDPSVYADAEMIALLVECLQKAGLSDFQISIGNVEYFKGVCQAAGLDPDTERSLRDYISGKNYFAAEDLLKSRGMKASQRDEFLRIADFMDDREALKKVREATGNERSRKAIDRLIDLCRVIEAYGYGRYISFDLTLLSKYHYYTGVIFKGYTYGTGEAIATGGRYDGLLAHFGKDAPSIGFMIQIDALLEAMQRQKIEIPVDTHMEKIEYRPETYDACLEKAIRLRREGIRTLLVPARDEQAE